MDYDRLRELQTKFDENPRRYFAPLANEYRKGGQPKRAIEICRAQLEQMPGHMSGQIVYGQALYEAGEFEESRQVFERALTLDPENLIALRSMGDMSLQAGNTTEARKWYSRLLDADPKDTAVIALISEIDAAADATPVAEVPGIDTDVGDQQMPASFDETPALQFLDTGIEIETSASSVTESPAGVESSAEVEASSAAESSAPTESQSDAKSPTRAETGEFASASLEPAGQDANQSEAAPSAAEAPLGLERHYEVEPPAPPDRSAQTFDAEERVAQPPDTEERVAQAPDAEGPSVEELGVTASASAAEGLTSAIPEDRGPLGSWAAPEEPQSIEASATQQQETEADAFGPPAEAFAPPPEPVAEPAEEKTFSGASAEPFVNETMAQLYLQQGYKQLALKVYRQLAVVRPNDEALRNRIAEIEAADAAEHPGEFPGTRREDPSIESPADRPAPRSPSIESPPPPSRPTRDRESVEAPARDEPRAEPEAAHARQPSIREFFATLGRRRPPRPTSGGSASSGGNSGGGAPRPANNQPADTSPPLGASPPTSTLDTVFAGATVSPADARAASRLAGAFSGGSGASRTPPTPPMPTPRINTRVQAQESEEDVAKFRAWLDGLTGE
jgi:tetratricopeptide (TPR) repeat protein